VLDSEALLARHRGINFVWRSSPNVDDVVSGRPGQMRADFGRDIVHSHHDEEAA
jgi:hypothetical protein